MDGKEDKKVQLQGADVYLLIPGYYKLDKRPEIVLNDLCDQFINGISASINAEYESEEKLDSLERYSLGNIELIVNENGEDYKQPGFVSLMIHHETRLCVLELIVPNAIIGGNKIISHYTYGSLNIVYNGQQLTCSEFLAKLSIEDYGQKRSMVFSDENTSFDEIVNALINEEYPDGKLVGSLADQAKNNLAQYDTAKVYASRSTMIEVCSEKTWQNEYSDRIAFQVTEVFLLELLLILDASIDKIYYEILEDEKKLRSGASTKSSKKKLDEITYEMSWTVRFSDFNRFRYPTTRESANVLSKAFGIDDIFKKYENNRKLLSEMIQISSEKESKERDKVKNRFLFFITALSMISAVNGALDKLNKGDYKDYNYFIAIAIVLACYGIFKLITKKPKEKNDEKK